MSKYRSMIIITFLFIASCAPKMYINIDGNKIPNNYYHLQTIGDTGIDIDLLFQKFLITKNEGERVLASRELSFTKNNIIYSKNLVDVKVTCKIENRARKYYNVWTEFIIHSSNETFSTKITKQLYSGKLKSQILTINIPTLKKGVIETTIKFTDETNYPIIILNNIKTIFK